MTEVKKLGSYGPEQPEIDKLSVIKTERERNIENIYSAYHKQLVNFAKHLLIDSGVDENEALNDSEDMVSRLYTRLLDEPAEINLSKNKVKMLAGLSKLLEKVIINYLKERNAKHKIPQSELIQTAQLQGSEPVGISPEEDIIETNNLKIIFSKDLYRLSPRERKVIAMRYGLPPYDREYILDDVGLELGVTRERIRQIEAKALRKLRQYSALRHASVKKVDKIKVKPEIKEINASEELSEKIDDTPKLDRYREVNHPEQKFFSESIKQIRFKEGEFFSIEKRKRAIEEIKATILDQQKGLGLFIKDVYDQIYQDTKISYEQIQQILNEYSIKYAFSDEQLIQINTALKEFWEKHQVTEEVRGKYESSPGDLFELCFGRLPKAPIRVIYGPMTITFILTDMDYNFAHSGHDVPEYWTRSELSGGSAQQHARGRLWGIVNIVRATQDGGAILHEDQHQFNKLFIPKEDRQELSYKFLESVAEKGSTQKARRQKIAYALAKNLRKQTVDIKARDEILAQLRNKQDTYQIYQTIAENPLYQYFTQRDIERQSHYIRDFFKFSQDGQADEKSIAGRAESYLYSPVSKLSPKAFRLTNVPTENEVKEQTERAFKNYHEDLKDSLDAVKALQQSGMSNDEIIPLLYTMPMDRWKVFVRRFLRKQSQVLETAVPQAEVLNLKQGTETLSQNLEKKPKKWYETLFDYRSLWAKDTDGGGHGGHH